MENISKVEITMGRNPSIYIEKADKEKTKEGKTSVKREHSDTVETPHPGFGSASAYTPEPSTSLATEAQRKYADDLANKLGEGDMMNVVYGLAQALGDIADNILHPSLWKSQMTRDQADAYIDVLEQQWNKQKKSRGGF